MRPHYHVIRDGGFEEEFTVRVENKAQVQRAARYQAIREANRLGVKIAGNVTDGYDILTRYGPTINYSWQRCSQEPCTAVHEDSPSLPGLPMP